LNKSEIEKLVFVTVLRLATSVEEMNNKFKNFQTSEGREQARSFVPNATDIFISPFAKSGTTWTQQIVHSLRTRGDMDFKEIMEVVPWLGMAYDLGVDIHAPQKALPRAFKSHATWDNIPKGARYIYSVRDPKDVVVSDYNFLGGWIFDKDAISVDEFVEDQYLKSNPYWKHIKSWWSQHNNPDVLFLCFEEMKRDLGATIRMIADFMHIELDDELFEIVSLHASFNFMKAHNDQFDDHMIRDALNEKLRLPSNASSSKVKNGRVGDHKQHLSSDLIETIDARWTEWITPAYGLASYADLRQQINDMNQKQFGHLI
jgi:hypothetical protein